jgi:hypothetical protein
VWTIKSEINILNPIGSSQGTEKKDSVLEITGEETTMNKILFTAIWVLCLSTTNTIYYWEA